MTVSGDANELLAAAREAFARRDWVRARDMFMVVRGQAPLSADDTVLYGDAVWWLGGFREAEAIYAEAYHLYLEDGNPRRAALAALAIAGFLFMRGDLAAGSGWMSRGVRLLEEQPEGAEHGYLLFMSIEEALSGRNWETAVQASRQMQVMGRQYADPNLVALGVAGEGRALIKQGQVRAGIALLDEAMLAALSDGLDPGWAGNIYCQLMRACYELSDLRRAGEWTRATARWCESLPAAGPFMGVCRVHRAQVLAAHGAWGQAEREAARVSRELADFDLGTVAEAHYQLGEVQRLRGDFDAAEGSYRQAHELGRSPHPGLALLRLAQGQAGAAHSAIQSALDAETGDPLARARLCPAAVEIALAAGEPGVAARISADLTELAALYGSSGLQAGALSARGAVLLAQGDTAGALATLREACMHWQRLGVPYEVARVRVLLAEVCAWRDDHDTAALELDAAVAVFTRLGAAPDVRRVAALRSRPAALPGGLTEREAEVLRLVAAGKSNREIAAALVISEKTAARHLANIFTKLDLSSRTAAAAYAFEHGLARRGHG